MKWSLHFQTVMEKSLCGVSCARWQISFFWNRVNCWSHVDNELPLSVCVLFWRCCLLVLSQNDLRCSALNVNVVRYSNKLGQTTGVIVNLIMCPDFCYECQDEWNSNMHWWVFFWLRARVVFCRSWRILSSPGGLLAVWVHFAIRFSTWTEMTRELAEFLSGSESAWRVVDLHGRSLYDSLSPCGVTAATHGHSLLQSNVILLSVSDSVLSAVTVLCRTREFSAVSISLCGKRLLELLLPMSWPPVLGSQTVTDQTKVICCLVVPSLLLRNTNQGV